VEREQALEAGDAAAGDHHHGSAGLVNVHVRQDARSNAWAQRGMFPTSAAGFYGAFVRWLADERASGRKDPAGSHSTHSQRRPP
jgi:hypothetical protein